MFAICKFKTVLLSLKIWYTSKGCKGEEVNHLGKVYNSISIEKNIRMHLDNNDY